MTPENFARWEQLQTLLKSIKNEEMALRKELAALVMQGKQTGSASVEMFGREISVSVPLAHTVDDSIRNAPLTNGQRACVQWKPSLKVREFSKLQKTSPEEHAQLVLYVTSKPGTPTVKVSEPVQV